MDFSPESDFQTWTMLFKMTLDDNGEIQYLQNDFIRLLKYYVENNSLPSPISEFNNEYINIFLPDIIIHITTRPYYQHDTNNELYLFFLVFISKQLIELLSKDELGAVKGLDVLFNYDDPFFQSSNHNTSSISPQFKKFCLDFSSYNSLDPLIQRLKQPNPQVAHFYQFFRILSLAQSSYNLDTVICFMLTLKQHLIAFINSIDFTGDLSAIADPNELLFIGTSISIYTSNLSEFNDLLISVLQLSLRCLKCESLNKQICGAKLLNTILEQAGTGLKSGIELLIQNSDIYNLIVGKNYHESVLPHLVFAFNYLSTIKRDSKTFSNVLIRIATKILHSHFTTKDLWAEMLIFGLINSYQDKEVIESFLFDYLLKLEQNEITIEIIEKLILELPQEFNEFTIKLLDFLLSLIHDQTNQVKTITQNENDQVQQTESDEVKQNENDEIQPKEGDEVKQNENDQMQTKEGDDCKFIQCNQKCQKEKDVTEFALNSIKRIAICTTVDEFRNLILEYCRKKLITDGISSIVIGILQFLIESSSLSTTGVSVNQIVDDNLIDTLLSALKSNEKDKESIFDLLTACYSKISITPIQMNSKQVSEILLENDSNVWQFFSALLDVRGIDFLDSSSFAFLQSYLKEAYDYANCTQEFGIFLLRFVLAIGTSQNKITRAKIHNKWKYTIFKNDLIGIDFILRALYESIDNEVSNHIINIILYLIGMCKSHDQKGGMIQLIFSRLIHPSTFIKTASNDDLNPRIYSLFVKIINKFEEGIGIEEFGYKRHIPIDTSGNIDITVDSTLKLNVSPYITYRSLYQKIGYHLKSTEDSISITVNGLPISSYDIMIALDIKNGANIEVDKFALVSCNYSVENVPTFIFMKNDMQSICLKLLRKEMSKNNKESVWKLLKLLPSIKFDDSNDLIEKVKNAIDEYELLYLLQISYKNKTDCSQIILEMISQRKEIITKNAISPAFAILSESSIKLTDYIDLLLDLILHNLLNNLAVESSIRLLKKLSDEDNSKISNFLLGIDYIVLSPNVLNKLNHIIQVIQEKQKLFVHLSKYISSIKNDDFCIPYFSLLSEVISFDESGNVFDNSIKACFELLSKHEKAEHLIYGVCVFLNNLFNSKPEITPKYALEMVNLLVPRLFCIADEYIQNIIVLLLEKSSKNAEAKERKNKLLASYFSIQPNQWGYDPSQNIKVHEQQTGLKNLGATCYLNSILQQLYGNSEFRSSLSQFDFNESNTNSKVLGALIELQKLFVKMQLTNLPFLDTKDFCKNCIFVDNEPINVRQQQDAIEFFQFLIDKLPKNMKDLYEGQIVNTIEGINIEYESKNYESFYNLCLTVKGFSNIEESFESFLSEEIFHDENQYYADTIGAKIDARKYSRISKLPSHLVIQLKRFEYNLETYMKYKVNDYFEFPFELDVSKYTINPNEKQLYELTGVVIHNGIADAGHYYSLIRIDDKWYCFDDNSIYLYDQYYFNKYVYGQNVGNCPSAYLLFYTKKDSITPYSIERFIYSKEELANSMNQNIQFPTSEENESKSFVVENSGQNEASTISKNDLNNSLNQQNECAAQSKIKNDFNANNICLFCDPSLREEIDKENKMYLHMQSSFTSTILQFMHLIDDYETLTMYALNVLLHSTLDIKLGSDLLIHLSKSITNSDEFTLLIFKNSKAFFDNLLYSQSPNHHVLFLKIVLLNLLKSSFLNVNDDNIEKMSLFCKDAFGALAKTVFNNRAIPLISEVISAVLHKPRGLMLGLKSNYPLLILEFIHLIINTNQSESFWLTANFKYLLESLIILKDGIESKMLVTLMNNCNNFLMNEENSMPFIKLFMTCYEFDLFVSHVFRLFKEQTISAVVVNTFCSAENEAMIQKYLKLFLNQSEVSKCDISFYLYESLECLSLKSSEDRPKVDIIDVLIKYPDLLLFDFLTCEDEISRLYTEKIIYSLFSDQGMPTTTNKFIQKLLNKRSENLLSKELNSDSIKTCINVDCDHNISLFAVHFLAFLSKLLNADNNDELFAQNRLISTARIIRWMISSLNNYAEIQKSLEIDDASTQSVIKSLIGINTLIFNKVIIINNQYDGNVFELLVNVLYILTIDVSCSIDIKTTITSLFIPNVFNLYPLYVSNLFLVTFAILLKLNNKDVFDTTEWKFAFIEFLRKAPNDAINDFSALLNNEEKNLDISQLILTVIESNMHQLIINNVFPIIKIVFSLNVQIPQKLFEDLMSFLIVFVEMNLEKTTIQSTEDVNLLLQSSLKHLENQSQITADLFIEHVPMFIDLYCTKQNADLRRTIRDFIGILCQKSEVLKEHLMELIYQHQSLDSISFFLHVVHYETDLETFSSFFKFLLSNIQICMKDDDDCEECFSELMLIINSNKIDSLIPKDANHPVYETIISFDDPNFIWTSFVDIAKFLLTIFDWKDKTQEFFLFVLKRMNENEFSKIIFIVRTLITQMYVKEGVSKAALIVKTRPEFRELVVNILEITKDSVNLWPKSCKQYSDIFFK